MFSKRTSIIVSIAIILIMAGATYLYRFPKPDKIVPMTGERPAISLEESQVAYFAGGCFWCTEQAFQELPGVVEVVSGFTGGEVETPSYDQVSSGQTKHTEAVKVYYDANRISYKDLLQTFWMSHDPTDNEGQFADRGQQYRPGIFYETEEQRIAAEESRQEFEASEKFDKPLVSEITAFNIFYEAEDYHQDYYLKNPIRYSIYKKASGRTDFLKELWGNKASTKEELRSELTPMQFFVTQQDGTEPPFENAYWDNEEDGIYVDIVSGEALFSSTHKFESETGWPSFYETIAPENIIKKTDYKLILPRTEVRSSKADSHLGHVFSDGPEPTGLRYCMNSAAMDFIPLGELEEKGYGEYLSLF